MAEPGEIAALAATIRDMEPCARLQLAIGLIEQARTARGGSSARSCLVLAATIARTVCDEITALDIHGKLGPRV